MVKRELPRLPKEVKVKKLWDSVVISQIDDSAEAKSPMASIRVKVKVLLYAEHGGHSDPERLDLERMTASPIGPITSNMPGSARSPRSARSP